MYALKPTLLTTVIRVPFARQCARFWGNGSDSILAFHWVQFPCRALRDSVEGGAPKGVLQYHRGHQVSHHWLLCLRDMLTEKSLGATRIAEHSSSRRRAKVSSLVHIASVVSRYMCMLGP